MNMKNMNDSLRECTQREIASPKRIENRIPRPGYFVK